MGDQQRPDHWRVGVAVLAAGLSRRFGDADKLAQPFRGSLLGEHAARAIPQEHFTHAWIIAAHKNHPCEAVWIDAGFEIAINPCAADGMATSVELAARLADQAGCDSLMIALADMPLVDRRHFAALARTSTHHSDILISIRDRQPMPPALFGRDHFADLSELKGDAGARELIRQGQAVECPAQWLIDIDTPEALARHS